jgi:hypothetical protein
VPAAPDADEQRIAAIGLRLALCIEGFDCKVSFEPENAMLQTSSCDDASLR